MDVGLIRARFIKDHLNRALLESDGLRAARVMREFGLYFDWFGHSLPRAERESITMKLAELGRIVSSASNSGNGVIDPF